MIEELFRAAASNNSASVRTLIAAGADPNCVSDYGHTPLHNACITGSAQSVAALLAGGADSNQVYTYRSPVDGRVDAGFSALMVVASAEVAQLLLNAGADVDIASADGSTALMRAAFRGHPETVRVLLAAGASAGARNTKGESAVDMAKGQIDFWRAAEGFREGHAEKRVAQFKEICGLLTEAEECTQ